jgi:hypothetical protein
LPTINDDDSFEVEEDHSGESNQGSEDSSGKGAEGEMPGVEATQTSGQESHSDSSSEVESKDQSFTGTVESIAGDIVVVNGQIMNVSSAEIKGTPQVGSAVKVEGYTDANGLFIVTKIEFQGSISNDGSGSGSDDGGSNTSGGDDSGGGGGSDDGGGDHGGS